jgi:hypothetical protein
VRCKAAGPTICRGRRGSGPLPMPTQAAAESREAAYGQVRPLGVAQGAEVAVQHERVMERQEVVNAARGQQAAKVTQAGLQAEGDEQCTLIRRVQAKRVRGRRLGVREKQAVEDGKQAASLGGAALDEVLHKGIVTQRSAQHWVPAAGRDAITPEHGPAAVLEGEGWVTQGTNRRLEGSHGPRADGAPLGERRAIDGGLAWGTDKTNRSRAAVGGRGRSRRWRRGRSGGREDAEGLRYHARRAKDMDVIRIGKHNPPSAQKAL